MVTPPATGVVSDDVLDILTRLVDKSLVVAAASGSEARFTMHETVRAYAREKLVHAGEAEAVLRAHRDWYLDLVERAKPEFFRGPPPLDWLAVFDREQDNLRLALEWSRPRRAAAAAGLRLAAGLWRYWEIRSRVVEGRLWLERTLQATDGDVSALRANALTEPASWPTSRATIRRRSAITNRASRNIASWATDRVSPTRCITWPTSRPSMAISLARVLCTRKRWR